MNVELINTGSELMLGLILNTHQQWLCQQLARLGFPVTRQVAIPDNGDSIQQCLREALTRADLILVTGGLGPTSDDLTRDKIAALLGRSLHLDPVVLQNIEQFFAARGRPMPDNTRVQALVPENSLVLPNHHGTAPGLVLETAPNQFRSGPSTLLVLLPGPTRELRPMFLEQVVPLLGEKLPPPPAFICRTYRTTGLGESLLEKEIAPTLQPLCQSGLELGFCAAIGQVDVRIIARGHQAQSLIAQAEIIIQNTIGEYIFALESEELPAVIIRLLTEKKRTLALAESCTGGAIAHRLTNVPGASAVFWAGLVTYSNEAKQELLGVSAETLAAHGAVSRPTAREMAEGCRAVSGTDFALSITGIAGPSGGTPQKPVGTVYIGLSHSQGTDVRRFLNPYDRETFKHITSQQALEMLRRLLVS